MILFTTGRGTPLSAPIPTLKLATNTALADKKPHWIDHNSMAESDDTLFSLCIKTAQGHKTRAEQHGCYDIAIFKDGVTL
jgi:altronate hydrolase